MATLTEVLAAVRSELGTLPAINYLPDAPPEQLSPFELPAIIVYSAMGEFRWESHYDDLSQRPLASGYRTVTVDVHLAREDLAINFAEAVKYADLVPMKLMDAFLASRIAGTAVTLGRGLSGGSGNAPIRYQFGAMTYGGVKTIGFQFSVDVSFTQEIV
jgi:hypothetical protein